MSDTSFFKYCPVYQDEDFSKEYSITNLINSVATFSNRKNFNDLFDSKVDLVRPTWQQLKTEAKKLNSKNRADFKSMFMQDNWKSKCDEYEAKLTDLLDNYLYYCVTNDGESNLMWSHYASSHTGFCIEWDSKKINAQKVSYEKNIAKCELIDLIRLNYGQISKSDFEDNTLVKSMLIKLEEWRYESEYRFQLSNSMETNIAKKTDKYALVRYKQEWIKSIIFGCRTSEKTKLYITKHLSSNVKLKQAYEAKNRIKTKEVN